MNRGRDLGLAAILFSGLEIALVAAAPVASAAGPDSSTIRPTGWHSSALNDDPPRGDYARGYDDGRQQGVSDGTHDAEVDCSKHKKMSARGAGDYQRAWENGYNNGYEFGYTRTYDQQCKTAQKSKTGTYQFKSNNVGKPDKGEKPDKVDKSDSGGQADKGSDHGNGGDHRDSGDQH